MGFNWQGAVGGLLGEMGTQATNYAARQEAIEQRKIEQAIADRREQTKLVREMGLAKYKADLSADVAKTKFGYDSDLKDKEIKAKYDLLSEKQKGDMSLAQFKASVKGSGNGGSGGKIIGYTENGKPVRDSEYQDGMTLYKDAPSRDGGKKSGLTETQQMQAEMTLAELEGEGITDETTAKQANAIRRRLGMPELKKVEKEPGRGGILGIGSKDPVYEYVEDYEGMGAADKPAENAEGKPVENKPAENKGGSLLDQVDKILPPAGAKAATKPVEEEKPAGTGKSMSADLGSVLGTIVKGGVGAVQKLAAGGQDLMELDRQLTAASQTAHGESKSALLKALAAVRQVMAAETNPEAELRSRAIAPNQ